MGQKETGRGRPASSEEGTEAGGRAYPETDSGSLSGLSGKVFTAPMPPEMERMVRAVCPEAERNPEVKGRMIKKKGGIG